MRLRLRFIYVGGYCFKWIDKSVISLILYRLFLSYTIPNVSNTHFFLTKKNKKIFVTGGCAHRHTHTQKCDEGQWHPVAWLLGCRCCGNCYLVVLVASLLLCVCVCSLTFLHFCVCMSFLVYICSTFSCYNHKDECLFFPCCNCSIQTVFNEKKKKKKKSRLMTFKQPEACLTSVKTQNYQLSVSAKHSSYQGSYNS